MRLDKYLKISRLIKRRPVATLMCSEGKITVDERAGKASTSVKEGQIIKIDFTKKILKVKVLEVPDKSASKAKSKELYELLEEIWVKEL